VAGARQARQRFVVRVFCFGDAVTCAVAGQHVPDDYHHLDRMIVEAAHHGTEVGLCGTWMDARGITDDMIIDSARRSSLDEVTDWVLWADKTITF